MKIVLDERQKRVAKHLRCETPRVCSHELAIEGRVLQRLERLRKRVNERLAKE